MKMTKLLFLALITIPIISACSNNANKANLESSETSVPVCRIIRQRIKTHETLPGDLMAYRDVAIYPQVKGYVQWLPVDRGSVVRRGQVIVQLSAPELGAHTSEALNQAHAASDQRREAQAELRSIEHEQSALQARLKAEEDTYQRLKEAASYPGVIAGNDLEIAEKAVESDKQKVAAYSDRRALLTAKIEGSFNKEKAALDSAHATKDVEEYLKVVAPFDGIVTERNVHEGSFVSPPTDAHAKPLLRIQELTLLRLVVPVPESAVDGIVPGAQIDFSLPAFVGQTFHGTIMRVGHSLDLDTRTMPVELDVQNPNCKIAPGMYAQVHWPIERKKPGFLIPQQALVRTTERLFVVRIANNMVDWIDVKTGLIVGEMIEVSGNLNDGDLIAMHGSDELREGMHVIPLSSNGPAKRLSKG